MTSKPPLCCWLIVLGAAELRVERPIMAKIIFARNRASSWIELTATIPTIDVRTPWSSALPETSCNVHSIVSSDVDKLYFLTIASTKIDNIEVLEVSSNVISKIHTVGWETACCSPVSRVTLQGSHSCQTQPVQVPVLGVLVHWSVLAKWSAPEWGKGTMRMAPRHHQGPSSAALWLKIAISWKTVAVGTIQFVHTTTGIADASLEVVQTGEGMKNQFCVNAWRSRTGISLKNVVEYCKLYQFLNKNAGLVNNIFGNLTEKTFSLSVFFLSLLFCFFIFFLPERWRCGEAE